MPHGAISARGGGSVQPACLTPGTAGEAAGSRPVGLCSPRLLFEASLQDCQVEGRGLGGAQKGRGSFICIVREVSCKLIFVNPRFISVNGKC